MDKRSLNRLPLKHGMTFQTQRESNRPKGRSRLDFAPFHHYGAADAKQGFLSGIGPGLLNFPATITLRHPYMPGLSGSCGQRPLNAMKKIFLNAMLAIQKRQGWLFFAIIFFNELYIKAYRLLCRPRLSLTSYSTNFSVGQLDCVMKVMDDSYLGALHNFFISSVDVQSPDFIMPHGVDLSTLKNIFSRRSHIPLGIFHDGHFIGYALIRLLFPKTASYSIFIAKEWQGRGIGTAALARELEFIHILGFTPYSAVSKTNKRSLRMLNKLDMEFSDELDGYFMVKDKRQP